MLTDETYKAIWIPCSVAFLFCTYAEISDIHYFAYYAGILNEVL